MSIAPRALSRFAWSARWLWLLVFVALSRSEAATLTRTLAAHFTPGIAFNVTIRAEPDPDTAAYAVEEHFPSGWTVSFPSHGGVLDLSTRILKWGPFTDAAPLERVLTYTVAPPAGARGEFLWSGEGRFNLVRVPITGDSQTGRFPGELIRQLPSFYVPGQALTVVLAARPATDVHAYAVEEGVPMGWVVSGISDGGEFDALNRKVKWGPFVEPIPFNRDLNFTLTPGSAVSGPLFLLGRAVFDAVEVLATDTLPRQPSAITPSLAATYEPGVNLPLALGVEPAPFVHAYAVEQTLPAGWTASALSHGGVVDSANRMLKWGPFTDPTPQARSLTATLLPPPEADGAVSFPGTGVFDTDRILFASAAERFRLHPDSTVTSVLPPEYEPGTPMAVALTVTPRDGTPVYSVEDTLPPGWTIVSLSSGGAYDAVNHKVKWGPFYAPDTAVRVLNYQTRSGPGATGEARFDGAGWFGEVPRPITGDRVTVAPAGRLTRTLPPRYTPEVPFSASLDAAPGATTDVFALEEAVPPGWNFVSATEGGIFDPINRLVKWGPFPDRTRRTLAYQVIPPANAGPETDFSGGGVFNRTPIPTTGEIGAVRNTVPRAIPNAAGRTPGELFKISAIKILLNDSDDDGDFLTVTEVSPLSAHGAEVILSWPWIYYIPTPGYDGSDTFTYTVSDGFGGTASALIQILVNPPPASAQNIISIETLPDGSRRIRFAGLPGYTYHIEASTDLVAWVRLADVTAASNGQFEFIDLEVASFPIRYYRSTWP